jgi:ATP-dependent DNA ligase
MLSTATKRWPASGHWALQPKWDGFRLLIEVRQDGRPRAWSRQGVNLIARLPGLPHGFEAAAFGSLFDDELVAVGCNEQRPVQDFAMVCRAVLRGDRAAADRLRFVAFDVLELAGENLRHRPWHERDQLLADALPQSPLVRRIDSLAATEQTHQALLALGFEGSVLKRRNSIYRLAGPKGGSSAKLATPQKRCCSACARTARGSDTRSATPMAGRSQPSRVRAPRIASARSYDWSTRAWTPTVAFASRGSKLHRAQT